MPPIHKLPITSQYLIVVVTRGDNSQCFFRVLQVTLERNSIYSVIPMRKENNSI